jgi:N-methylhydantoinase B
MFHPVEPQPCYLYGWSLNSAMEGMFQALAAATGGQLPSGSSGDIAAVLYYGTRPESGEIFFGGSSLPVGHGASREHDGATLYVAALAHSQTQSPELQEAKTPVRYEKWEFTPDSAGAGTYRGGSGWEMHYRVLQDVYLISTMERTKVPGWAQLGGEPGTRNKFEVDFPDGHTENIIKTTDRLIPAGSLLRIYCGGGGGYGSPGQRDREAVEKDMKAGLITRAHAQRFYPHTTP